MPLSGELDEFTCADAHKREMNRTRLSVESTYRYGISRMAKWLSLMEREVVIDSPKTSAPMVQTLTMMRARLSAILPNRPRLTETMDVLGYANTRDRVIVAYEIMFSTVTNLMTGHRGTMHTAKCGICIALLQCVSIDLAVRETLPAIQRADDARRALLPGPPVSHRCHVTGMRVGRERVWRVTCLCCGVVSRRPYADSGLVADIARHHATMAGKLDKARAKAR